MSYSVHDHDDLESDLGRLRQRTDELADEVEELQGRHRSLDAQVDGVEAELREAEDDIGRLRGSQHKLGKDLSSQMASVAAAVRSLAGTVGWIERRLHAEQDIASVDLDSTDDTLRRLARQARQGRQSAAVLLTRAERARLEELSAALRRLEEQIDETENSAIEQSATLAGAPAGSEVHLRAAAGYRALIHDLARYRAQLPEARQADADARRQLQSDDEQRQVHGPQVMTGEAARTQLITALRTRLDAAVAGHALLPAWLVLALGYQPVGEDVASWMDTATSLLSYRVIYQVSDPVVALGPDDTDDQHQQDWREDLDKRLRTRRRWPI